MSSYHIFLIDSDKSHAQKIKEHLKYYSEYVIDIFTDVIECKKKISTVKPAVIFLDDEIHHENEVVKQDIEFMKQLKDLSPSSEVILFTGEERMHLMPDNIKNGAHDFVVKSETSHIQAESAILSAIRHYRKNAEAKINRVLVKAMIVFVALLTMIATVGYITGALIAH
jgi:DNA-binding NtrC family response regulator